ncbi:MAG TPA: YbjN domain-containing protein [Thermoanaerobaculia bacterium]|nr:YbjN domain-containing protein [Thermoanaerobaculia bacterium]
MKKLALGIVLTLACSIPALGEECTSKLQGFVNQTGYKLIVAKPCAVWIASDALTIPHGEGLTGLLLIAQQGDMGVVGAVVQPKAKLKLSADLLLKLMQLNNELEYTKVGIDSDGDLFVRAELHMTSITAEEFSAVVKTIVEGSNKVYDALKK